MGASNDSKGSVKKLDTSKLKVSALEVKRLVEEFQDSRANIDKINTTLMAAWVGESRDEYEIKYNVLKTNLKDIEDALYDFYDGIVESQAKYMESDDELAKMISGEK